MTKAKRQALSTDEQACYFSYYSLSPLAWGCLTEREKGISNNNNRIEARIYSTIQCDRRPDPWSHRDMSSDQRKTENRSYLLHIPTRTILYRWVFYTHKENTVTWALRLRRALIYCALSAVVSVVSCKPTADRKLCEFKFKPWSVFWRILIMLSRNVNLNTFWFYGLFSSCILGLGIWAIPYRALIQLLCCGSMGKSRKK
jgi:hypothetical protein